MSDRVYALRCVRCLLSICHTEPRELARLMGQHRCDPTDALLADCSRLANRLIDTFKNMEGRND